MEIRVGYFSTFPKDILLYDNFFHDSNLIRTRGFLKGSPGFQKMQISDFFTRTHVFQDYDFRMKSRTKSFVRDFQRILVLGENFSRANFSGSGRLPARLARTLESSVLSVPGDYHGDRGPLQVNSVRHCLHECSQCYLSLRHSPRHWGSVLKQLTTLCLCVYSLSLSLFENKRSQMHCATCKLSNSTLGFPR